MEKIISVKLTKYLKIGIVLKGAEIIMASGGIAVDADDCTPNAIKEIADRIITYGSSMIL